MKKVLACILIASLMLTAACYVPAEPIPSIMPSDEAARIAAMPDFIPSPSIDVTPLPTPPPSPPPTPLPAPSPRPSPPNRPAHLPELPEIDGSTSTQIMHAAIRAHLTGGYFVYPHSRTYAALERLIPRNESPVDVVLAVKYYDKAIQDANNRGANLVITPIAKEGFVFVVHKDNPVESLTQEQLRGIYSGKIRNWSEVGGKDEEIAPFQRNEDSGSQTAMANFMDGAKFQASEMDMYEGSMGSLIAGISNYGSRAIGYSIYSWSMKEAVEQFGELKAIKVDGVRPSDETIASEKYPLLIYTYSYYNRGNEKAKALADWLITDEGQGVIARAGYVGIRGAVSTLPLLDYSIDTELSYEKMRDHCVARWGIGIFESLSHQLVTDREQIKTLAQDQGAHMGATMAWRLYHYDNLNNATTEFGYVVLSKPYGGEFEVVRFVEPNRN